MKMKTMDSTLSFYVNQLDNLDPKLHEPLYSVTWSRDISLRTGITMANESTSFTRSTIGATGTQSATGLPFLSGNTNSIPQVSVNGERITLPLRLLGHEISYSSVELERSQLLGQSIDTQKFNALQTIYQMGTDQMIYIGDDGVGAKGMLNSDLVTATSAEDFGGAVAWNDKTPDQILSDVNVMLETAWAASGYAVCPDSLLLPPAQFAYISSQKVSTAGSVSILTFLEDNAISLRVNGAKLSVRPVKWLDGRGVGSTNRAVVYSNNQERLRFPMVPIRRETAYYQGINFNAPYIWALGEVEIIYPETMLYTDGI
jgi:hypothetical protein